MPYFLYTFRPQITEQNLFEQFLDVFIPFLKEFEEYSYSVEEDGTLQQHIHIMYKHKATDNSKALPQKLDRKLFSLFKSAIKNKLINDKGFDDRKVADSHEDFLKVLGYVNKETDCIRRKSVGFTNEQILEAVKFYYTTKHLEKQKTKDDLIILTNKTVHIHVKNWCEKNNTTPLQGHTKFNMIKEGYMFETVGSRAKVRDIFQELDCHMRPEKHEADEFEGDDYTTQGESSMEAYWRNKYYKLIKEHNLEE